MQPQTCENRDVADDHVVHLEASRMPWAGQCETRTGELFITLRVNG